MKKFFSEFKTFISRGNVLDMAVGVIIGSAFTAIINALVNGILKPLISAIPGADGTSALQIVLRHPVLAEDNVTVLKEAVILDFGSVISAVITFLMTAFVLFLIVKTINTIRDGGKKFAEKQRKKLEKQLKKGKITEEEAAAQTEAAAVAEVPAAPVETTDDLLREIRDLLKAKRLNDATVKSETTPQN